MRLISAAQGSQYIGMYLGESRDVRLQRQNLAPGDWRHHESCLTINNKVRESVPTSGFSCRYGTALYLDEKNVYSINLPPQVNNWPMLDDEGRAPRSNCQTPLRPKQLACSRMGV